jgi:hypothetical protein
MSGDGSSMKRPSAFDLLPKRKSKIRKVQPPTRDQVLTEECDPQKAATAHEHAGRRHPRPRQSCTDCKRLLLLAWGDKIKPHWRHEAGETEHCTGHIGHADLFTHRQANDYLCSALGSGKYRVEVTGKRCRECDARIQSLVIGLELADCGHPKSFAREVSLSSKARLDIAGIDEAGRVVCGLELCHTHQTDPRGIEARDGIPWVELDASEVLAMLDSDEIPDVLRIDDMRTTRSESCAACIAKEQERRREKEAIDREKAKQAEARRLEQESIRQERAKQAEQEFLERIREKSAAAAAARRKYPERIGGDPVVVARDVRTSDIAEGTVVFLDGPRDVAHSGHPEGALAALIGKIERKKATEADFVDGITFQMSLIDYVVAPPSPGDPLPAWTNEPAMKNERPVEVPVIRIFGCTDEGDMSVMVRVHGFEPYFWCRLPDDYDQSRIPSLLAIRTRLDAKVSFT